MGGRLRFEMLSDIFEAHRNTTLERHKEMLRPYTDETHFFHTRLREYPLGHLVGRLQSGGTKVRSTTLPNHSDKVLGTWRWRGHAPSPHLRAYRVNHPEGGCTLPEHLCGAVVGVEVAMPDIDPAFPTDITPEEAEAGFELATVRNPTARFSPSNPIELLAVVRLLPDGNKAVKALTPGEGNGVNYQIWNHEDAEVQGARVSSLAALRQKYGI